MGRNIVFAPGEYYHIYNRGTEKREIFSFKKDYNRFLALLYFCNSSSPAHLQLQGRTLKEIGYFERKDKIVDICAYCLMPNHFHLLLHESVDGGISRFMQKVSNGYTGYFNKLYNRNGSLFQGKFKATHAKNDNYLKYLVSYIHLNPIKLIDSGWKENGIKNKADAEKFLNNYRYSSYLDYLNKNRKENIVIDRNSLPTYFDSPKDFKNTVTDWLTFSHFKVEP